MKSTASEPGPKFSFELIYERTCQLNKATQDLIFICKQTTFSPVSSINSSQTDQALPVKTSKPNSCISGTACLIICEMSLFVTAADGKPFSLNLREFGLAR